MTGPYELNPMPYVLDVRCPDCGGHAKFEFAESADIHLRKDITYFQNSKDFEYVREQSSSGQTQHTALYFHRLGRRELSAIGDLPQGYSAGDWEHSKYLRMASFCHTGAILCAKCGLNCKHELDWPGDAFFQIEYRNNVLWAFDRDIASELLEYIASQDRDRHRFRHHLFLMKIPSVFLSKKARETVVKKLAAVLG